MRSVLTWWHVATPGTRWYTFRCGRMVGRDAFGNSYFQSYNGERRWVIYSDEVEASRVPPGWYGWLHRTREHHPGSSACDSGVVSDSCARVNRTGTPEAYRPGGSVTASGGVSDRYGVSGRPVYQSWVPPLPEEMKDKSE